MQPFRSNNCSQRNRNRTNDGSEVLIEDLNISEAVARRLVRSGILTLSQLQSHCVDDLRRIYWIGDGAIRQIQQAVMDLGYEPLGVHVPRGTIKRLV